MKSSSIRMSVFIPAKPKDVFLALTDAKQISQWSGQKGKVAAKIGGKFEMFDGWVKGKVIEFKPAKVLAYTWIPDEWPKGTDESVVMYKFAATKNGTKVALVHSNIPNEEERKSHAAGWKQHVFDPLKSHFAK